jgi:voltage-gated potassium channel
MSAKTPSNELKNPGYEIFIAALSVLSIANILFLYLVNSQVLDYVLVAMNGLLTLVFLMDFLYRFKTAPSKSAYFFRGFGWADLLASLPFEQAKILRIFRLVKVVRLLREQGPRRIAARLKEDRAGSALFGLLLVAILMLEFGSLLMLWLEAQSPDANIVTATDALWYIVVTMSTVGYGDLFPVTIPGRVLGTTIIVIGVGIFGTLTGYLANTFLSPAKEPTAPELPPPDDVHARLRELADLADQQEALASRQKETLEALEALLEIR